HRGSPVLFRLKHSFRRFTVQPRRNGGSMRKLRQNRREFVKGLAALGAASLLPGPRSMAQTQPSSPRAIDVHQHFSSPAYLKALQAKEGKHTAGYTTWFA